MTTDPLIVRGRPTSSQTQLGWCGSPLQVSTQRYRDELELSEFPRVLPNLWPGSRGTDADVDPAHIQPSEPAFHSPKLEHEKTVPSASKLAQQGLWATNK